MIHHALAVAVSLFRSQSPGGDPADNGVEVVAFGLMIVLQQAPALQITDGVCQFPRGSEEFLRLAAGLDGLFVFLSALESGLILLLCLLLLGTGH